MKKFFGLSLILSLCSAVMMPIFAQKTEVASAATTPTGYTQASDVEYVKSGKYIANWGAREEDCTFLSSYATSFYTGSYAYEQMSLNAGGTSTSTAPKSSLYLALKEMMSSKQTYQTSYGATRDLFCYTDCVSSNYSKISSFYSGKQISGTWDGGSTWNREHTWPNSKGDASGNGENDIMMLRPTSVSENSSRGNKAYGESSKFYDPNEYGENVRGDCARIMLFVYTRWGNTESMWGSSGVMESLDILLKWMEEDPVDTWEMGRNDAVQSITGTRNVFVDYPEYAWKLFGRAIPADMVTPSNKANSGADTPSCTHTYGSWIVVTPATTESTGLQKQVCSSCGFENLQVIPKLDKPEECNHRFGSWTVVTPATETEDGLQKHACRYCGYEETEVIPKLEKPAECTHRFGDWTVVTPATETEEGLQKHACRYCGYEETEVIPKLEKPAECTHRFGDWTVVTPATETEDGLQKHACRYCGYEEIETIPALGAPEDSTDSEMNSSIDSEVDSDINSEIDSESSSDMDSVTDSAIDSETDSVIDSETDSTIDSDMIDDVLDSVMDEVGGSLDVTITGCEAVVGLPMLAIGILTAGGLLLKRKED